MSLVTQLKNHHVKGDKLAGLNLKKVIVFLFSLVNNLGSDNEHGRTRYHSTLTSHDVCAYSKHRMRQNDFEN